MSESLGLARYGDKQNSPFFEDYLVRLLEERDRIGLTGMIRQIDALMITVEPGNSLAYVGELCLMTPYHYLVTLETEQHATHVLRIDMGAPDVLVRAAAEMVARDPSLRRRLQVPAVPAGVHAAGDFAGLRAPALGERDPLRPADLDPDRPDRGVRSAALAPRGAMEPRRRGSRLGDSRPAQAEHRGRRDQLRFSVHEPEQQGAGMIEADQFLR